MIKIKGFHKLVFITSLIFIVAIILFMMGFSFGAGLEIVRRLIR